MIGTFARALVGFILACLTAALIQVLYVPTTYQLAASADSTFPGSLVIERVLLVATQLAEFAAPFALIVICLGVWRGIGSLPYYLASGAIIGLLGLMNQYSSEVAQQPTIFNNGALNAYLTSGFFAGLAYWLIAGRFAVIADAGSGLGNDATSGVPAPKSWKNRPKIIVEDNPGRQKLSGPNVSSQEVSDAKLSDGDLKGNKKPSLSQVLRDNSEASTEIRPAAKVAPAAAPISPPSSPAMSPGSGGPNPTSVPSTKPAAAPLPPAEAARPDNVKKN